MLTKILLKQLFKKPVVATINEHLLNQYVPHVLGLDIQKRHFARWTVRQPSKVFPPDDPITAGKEDVRNVKQGEINKSSSQHTSKGIKRDQNPPAKPVHSFENKNYMVLDENDYTFR